MKRPFFSSLIFKVGLVIIVIEIVVLTSTGIYYTRQFNEAVDARVYSRVAIPGQLMAKGMLEYYVVRDRVEMTELAGDDLVEAMVVAVTGNVFYSLNTEYEGKDTSEVPGLSPEWFSPSVTESFIREETEGGNRYVVSVTPIFAGETRKPYYFFYLKVSTNQAAQEKRNLTGLFLTGAIACVVLTSLAILFIFRIMISKRLSMALDGIKRFESGDLDARIEPVKSNDEIAILQHGINSMTSKLQEIIGNLKTEVSERVRAEERARRLLDQQIAVNQLALALGETRDLDEIYHTIYRHIRALVDTWGFIVSSYDNETQLIRAEYVMYKGTVLDVAEFPPIPLTEPGQGGQSQVIHTGKPMYTPDHRKSRENGRPVYTVEEDGTIREGPPPEEDEDSTKSALYVPMKIEGKAIGVMQLQSRQSDAYTREDIALLAAMANVAAVAVQNARLYGAVQRELAERVRAEESLKEHSERLEEMVVERTAELRQSEEKSRAQYKGIPVPTYTWQKVGDDFVLVDYNDAAEAITQGKIADFMGIKLAEMYRDMPEIREEIWRCLAEQTTIEREMPYPFQSTGESRHLAVKYAFVPPDLVLVHTEDVTERVQAEEEIEKHSAELRRTVNLMAGREVRMAELKGVIRQLRAQLEEAGLTPGADDPLLGGSS